MGASKQPDSEESAGLSAPFRFSGPGGIPVAALLGLVFFVGLIGAVIHAWRSWGRSAVTRPVYRIKVENIQMTPQPPWIRTDVREEIVRDNHLDDLTIFDKGATIQVYRAFESHPWVAKVLRVSKHPPARLNVDLEYRQPVAWVEVPATKPDDRGGVIPIDAFAHVLPTRDFTSSDLQDYLRIAITDVSPFGLAGTPWGDARVMTAAKIAKLLDGTWKALRLYRIQLALEPGPQSAGFEPLFELETDSRKRILWGRGPGAEASDEPAAVLKVARLKQLAEATGSLDHLPPSGTDLRDQNPIRAGHTAVRDRAEY
jgi:hypothetical protein